MAYLIPQLNSCLSRMTSGEKRFARRIEALLENDYTCWYDVTVGVKRRRPDFLLLHPLRGLLALEVKDWRLDRIRSLDPRIVELEVNGKLIKELNPLLKSRDFIQVTVAQLQKDPLLVQDDASQYAGKLCMPYGHGVVLSNISRRDFDASGMADVLAEQLVICQDEMTESVDAEAFQQRLWNMFLQPFSCRLTRPQIDRVRWHLFPEIRLQPRQDSLFGTEKAPDLSLPDLVRVMDLQQEQLARSLGEGHRVIHGVAGSGKTMILGYRAEFLARMTPKPVLVLCFNRALAQKLANWSHSRGLEQKVVVDTLHGWCSEMIDTYQLEPPPDGPERFNVQVQRVIDGVSREQVPAGQYSAVLIDEGHDFEPEWLRLVAQMVDPATNSLLILYDSAQDIYQQARKRRFSFASVGIQAKGRTTILKVNYRNTAEVLGVAHSFSRELLIAQESSEDGVPLITPQTAGRHGPTPEFARLANFRAEVLHIAERLRTSHAEGLPFHDMAILTYRKNRQREIVSLLNQAGIPATAGLAKADQVNVLTLHASKGLEYATVAIAGLGEMPYSSHNANEQARVLYVGMTRAMHSLLLTASQDSEFAAKASAACSAQQS